MSIEKGIPSIEPQSKQPKQETIITPQTLNSKEVAPRNIEKEKETAKKRDDAKIAEIRASLGIEPSRENENLRQHLITRFNLKEGDIERIKLLKAKNLPINYKTQYDALQDKRLENITIAVVPDDLWAKGNQPTESSAENQLISVKQSYFEARENPDEIAWVIHELAHCQNFLDSETEEDYQKNMRTFAFKDLKTEYSYPNNLVEQYAFTRQFQFLKEKGKSRENVMEMLKKYYNKEDSLFFDKLLDSVYNSRY